MEALDQSMWRCYTWSFCSATSHEVGKLSWPSEQSQISKVSGVWRCTVTLVKPVSDSGTVRLISEGERGWDLHDKGSKQWNEDLILMVHSGVHVGFFVGQNQFCLQSQKSQFWLFQLSIKWWLSVHLTLFRRVLLTGFLWAALFFPIAAAPVTFIGYTIVYNCGRHRKYCCFPQIHTPGRILRSITFRTNSHVDLHLTKPYF